MLSQEEIDAFASSLSGDEPPEKIYKELRMDGCTRLEAVRILLDLLGLSLAEAKTVLHTSDTWAEARQAARVRGSEKEASDPDAYDELIPPAPAD